MAKKVKSYIEWAIQEAQSDYYFYYNMYIRMMLARFKWTGTPDSVSAKFLERTLCNMGMCAVYRHKGGFLAVAEVISVDARNDNDEPTAIRVRIDGNRESRVLRSGEFVIIYNDTQGKSSRLAARHYAKRLEAIDCTTRVNLEQLKQPSIVVAPESQKLTVQNLWAQKESGAPIIMVDESAMEMIQFNPAALDLKVTSHMQELYEVKHEEINESMTYFGVNNVNVVKRERLTSGETEQNDEQIYLNAEAMLIPRRDACAEIERLFGEHWSVEMNRPEISLSSDETSDDNKEDENA